MEFPGGSGVVQMVVSFDVVVDDILESEEGFIILLQLDVNGSHANATQEVMITRNTTLARIENDDCKIIIVYLLYTVKCVIIVPLSCTVKC